MGHNYLGVLGRTYRWKQVVEILEGSPDIGDIANASLYAAEKGLRDASHDFGLTVLLTNIFKFVEAAKSKEYETALKNEGFGVNGDKSLFGLIAKFRDKVESDLSAFKAKSDVSEIATNSFVETLFYYHSQETWDLFGSGPQSFINVVKKYATKNGFKQMMHEFYSRFTRRYLNYYLSREMSNHVGPGRLLSNIELHKKFTKAFDLYIRQAVRIADEFTPGWFGKAQFQDSLNYNSVSKYAHVVFKKIISEFE